YEVSLNGTMLERNGDLQAFNSDDYSQVPRTMALPPQLLQKDNLLHIRIRADTGRRGGIPAVVVGPDYEVDALYNTEYRWRVTGSEVVVILSLLVGSMALALWFTQTDPTESGHLRRDPLYLFAGLAELCWALRVAMVLIEQPPLPWTLWGPLSAVALGGWVCFMMAFCCIAAGWAQHHRAPLFLRSLWAVLAAGGVCHVRLASAVAADAVVRPAGGHHGAVWHFVLLGHRAASHCHARARGARAGTEHRDRAARLGGVPLYRLIWQQHADALLLGGVRPDAGLHRADALSRCQRAGARPAGQSGEQGVAKRAGTGAELRAGRAAGAPAGAHHRAHAHPARHARRCGLAHQCRDPPAAIGQGQPRRGAADPARLAGSAQAVHRRDEPAARRRHGPAG